MFLIGLNVKSTQGNIDVETVIQQDVCFKKLNKPQEIKFAIRVTIEQGVICLQDKYNDKEDEEAFYIRPILIES